MVMRCVPLKGPFLRNLYGSSNTTISGDEQAWHGMNVRRPIPIREPLLLPQPPYLTIIEHHDIVPQTDSAGRPPYLTIIEHHDIVPQTDSAGRQASSDIPQLQGMRGVCSSDPASCLVSALGGL